MTSCPRSLQSHLVIDTGTPLQAPLLLSCHCQQGCVWGRRTEVLGTVVPLLALLAAGRCVGRVDLTTCSWDVPPTLYPSIPDSRDDKGGWLFANATRLGPASLRIELEGVETRNCRIYMDSHTIRRYRARTQQVMSGSESTESSANEAWSAFEVPAGDKIHLLTLWAREWGSRFEVELDIDAGADAQEVITGRVSCLWNDGPGGARIPALDEARRFLPEWVAISKATDGLVEAISGFVLRED